LNGCVVARSGRAYGGRYDFKRGRLTQTANVRQRAELRTTDRRVGLRDARGRIIAAKSLMFIQGQRRPRARLVSSREWRGSMAAWPDSLYKMPDTITIAYRVAGDGVAVPVVALSGQVLVRPHSETPKLGAVAERAQAFRGKALAAR